MKIFGREPALWLEAIKATLVVLALVLPGLSDDVQVSVMVIATAVFSLLQAILTRPFPVASITGFVQTVGMAVLAFGIDIPATSLAAIVVLVGAIVTLLSRQQISPIPSIDPAVNPR